MGNQIVLDITTNGNFQAFSKLDEEQKKATLEALRLTAAIKQAEAATVAYGASAARAHEQAAAAVTKADRAQRSLEQNYTQRISLRHGSDAVMTQRTRQMLSEIERMPPQQYGDYVAGFVSQADAVARRRNAIATRLRASRAAGAEEARRERQRLRDAEAIALQERGNAGELAADRPARRMSAAAVRRDSLRHGSQYAISQEHRQIVRQVFESGGDPSGMSEYTQAVFSNAQQVLSLRKTLADKTRALRKSSQNAQILASKSEAFFAPLGDRGTLPAGAFSQPWRVAHEDMLQQMQKEAEPFENGAMLNGFMLRGGSIEGESHWMTKARRTIAQRFAAMPGQVGQMTEEQLTKMAEGMASEMQSAATAAMSRLTTVFTAAAVGGYAAWNVGSAAKQRWDSAADRTSTNGKGRRSLRQVADSPYDLRQMLGAGEGLQNMLGISADEANADIFSLKSTDEFNEQGLAVVRDATRLGVNADTVVQAIQKLKANFGEKAGTSSELLSKLLIAAGPSPANVPDLAAGVGTMAQAWRSISGNADPGRSADESLAVLSALSVGGRNTESGATEMKQLASQLAKNRGSILWGGDQPMEGLDLVRALPQLAAQNRLLNEKGKPTSVEGFLGDIRAVTGYQQIIQQMPMIDRTMTQLSNPANRDLAARRAQWGDVQSDTAMVRDAALRHRENVENQKFAPYANLAQGMFAEAMANNEDQGHTNPWYLKMQETLNDLQTNPVANPGGYIGATQEMVSNGKWGNPELLEQYFRLQYGKYDVGSLQAALHAQTALMPGRYHNEVGPSGGIGDSGVHNRVQENMTAQEFAIRQKAIQHILSDRLTRGGGSGPAGGATSTGDPVMDDLIARRQVMSPKAMKLLAPGLQPVVQSLDLRLADREKSEGLTPDDPRTKALEKSFGESRREAIEGYDTAVRKGRPPEAAQKIAIDALNGANKKGDKAEYDANMAKIQTAMKQAQDDLDNASDPHDRKDKKARLDAMKHELRAASRGGGVSYNQAQELAQEFTGQGGDKLTAGVDKIVGYLDKLTAHFTEGDKKDNKQRPVQPPKTGGGTRSGH